MLLADVKMELKTTTHKLEFVNIQVLVSNFKKVNDYYG